MLKSHFNFPLQVCCPSYCWPVQTHASPSPTYRKTAGSLKASPTINTMHDLLILFNVHPADVVYIYINIYMYICLCVSAGVKQAPPGSRGNKLLRSDVGLASHTNRSERFVFHISTCAYLCVPVISRTPPPPPPLAPQRRQDAVFQLSAGFCGRWLGSHVDHRPERGPSQLLPADQAGAHAAG